MHTMISYLLQRNLDLDEPGFCKQVIYNFFILYVKIIIIIDDELHVIFPFAFSSIE